MILASNNNNDANNNNNNNNNNKKKKKKKNDNDNDNDSDNDNDNDNNKYNNHNNNNNNIQSHNKLPEAEMLSMVCQGVTFEPVLQDITGEVLNRDANQAPDARLDIRTGGLCERLSSAFLDVWVCAAPV